MSRLAIEVPECRRSGLNFAAHHSHLFVNVVDHCANIFGERTVSTSYRR